MYAPSNICVFYKGASNKEALFQGDIIKAETIGFKLLGELRSPDFWLIITKSCDLQFINNERKTKSRVISLVPLFILRCLNVFYLKDFLDRFRGKCPVVLIALMRLTLLELKAEDIEAIIRDRMSKFMYLPPDGAILTEPMIIDFECIKQINSHDLKDVENLLRGKVLELASPFREKVAQNFARHYSQIGVEDDEIREKSYKDELKKHLKSS